MEGGNPNSQLLRNKLLVQVTPRRATGCEAHPSESWEAALEITFDTMGCWGISSWGWDTM